MTKVSQRQKDLLADFMSENYQILFGKFSGGQGKNVKSKKWDEITKILNENGPPSKEVEKWKRTWADIKMAVKEKVKLIRQHRNRTGGGPPTTLVLTAFEERIKSICGSALMDGDPDVGEIGFTKLSNEKSSDSEIVALTSSVNEMPISISLHNEVETINCDSYDVPRTPSKSSNVPILKTTPKRFNVQQNQVENALELQKQTNVSLDKIIEQNDEILSTMTKMMYLLEKIADRK